MFWLDLFKGYFPIQFCVLSHVHNPQATFGMRPKNAKTLPRLRWCPERRLVATERLTSLADVPKRLLQSFVTQSTQFVSHRRDRVDTGKATFDVTVVLLDVHRDQLGKQAVLLFRNELPTEQ